MSSVFFLRIVLCAKFIKIMSSVFFLRIVLCAKFIKIMSSVSSYVFFKNLTMPEF